MSEEQAAEESAESAESEAPPEPEPAKEPAPEEKTTTDHVDMDDGTQKRFNRIYGNMKQYERVVQQMGKENRQLLDRLDKLEGTQYTQEVTTAVDNLKKDKVAALDDGNHQAVADIDDKIAQIRSLPEPQPTPKPENPDFQMSTQDNQIIAEWGNATDANGNFVRPWAQAGHPYNTKAAAMGAAVLEDDAITAQGTEAILAEVDRLMGAEVKKVQRTSPVLSSDGNVTPPKPKAGNASQDEKLIAKAMGVPIDKYMKSKQEILNAG